MLRLLSLLSLLLKILQRSMSCPLAACDWLPFCGGRERRQDAIQFTEEGMKKSHSLSQEECRLQSERKEERTETL
jgi:hypothetical protein